jgi:hypothetical protein
MDRSLNPQFAKKKITISIVPSLPANELGIKVSS